MAIADPVLHPDRFSRTGYYAIADALDSARRYELLDGTICAISPANPPDSGFVTFFANRVRALGPTRFLLRVQDTLGAILFNRLPDFHGAR